MKQPNSFFAQAFVYITSIYIHQFFHGEMLQPVRLFLGKPLASIPSDLLRQQRKVHPNLGS